MTSTHKRTGSSVFGIGIAESKAYIFVSQSRVIDPFTVILVLRTTALWGQSRKVLWNLSLLLSVREL